MIIVVDKSLSVFVNNIVVVRYIDTTFTNTYIQIKFGNASFPSSLIKRSIMVLHCHYKCTFAFVQFCPILR